MMCYSRTLISWSHIEYMIKTTKTVYTCALQAFASDDMCISLQYFWYLKHRKTQAQKIQIWQGRKFWGFYKLNATNVTTLWKKIQQIDELNSKQHNSQAKKCKAGSHFRDWLVRKPGWCERQSQTVNNITYNIIKLLPLNQDTQMIWWLRWCSAIVKKLPFPLVLTFFDLIIIILFVDYYSSW